MKKHNLLQLFLLSCLCIVSTFFISFVTTKAATVSIEDNADIIDSTVESNLKKELTNISNQYDVDLSIYTETRESTSSNALAANSLAKTKGMKNGVFLYVNMYSKNHGIVIKGYGIGKDYINDKRAEKITDSMSSYFQKENYTEGFSVFVTKTEDFLGSNPKRDGLFYQIWFQLIISVVIGAVLVTIMALNAGGKVTTSQATYLNQQNSRVVAQHDRYVRTSITRTKRSDDDSNDNDSDDSSTGESSF